MDEWYDVNKFVILVGNKEDTVRLTIPLTDEQAANTGMFNENKGVVDVYVEDLSKYINDIRVIDGDEVQLKFFLDKKSFMKDWANSKYKKQLTTIGS